MMCVFILLPYNAASNTTDWEWVTGAGSSGLDYSYCVTVDQDDNTYISGSFRQSGVFGDTTITYDGDHSHFFISKLDKDGNWLWTRGGRSFGAHSQAIKVDVEGNIIVAGYYYRELVLGDVTHIGPSELGFDLFIAKLDKDGNWLWSRSAIGDEDLNRQVFDFAFDSSGNIYLTGTFGGILNFGDGIILENPESGVNYGPSNMFVAKMSSDGRWLWARMARNQRGRQNDAKVIAIDNEDNIYVGGYFSNIMELDTLQLNSGENPDKAFLAKMNSDGGWIWAIHDHGTGQSASRPLSMAIDAAANLYLTGYFFGDVIFGDNELHTSSSFNEQIMVVKADSSGNWLWADQAGGAGYNHSLDIIVSDAGNLYLTGFFQRHNNPFGDIILDGVGAGNQRTIFIAKMDDDGNWLWADRAGSVFNDDRSFGLAVDRDENIFITGNAGNNASFGDFVLPGYGRESIFLAKMRVTDRETSAGTVLELPSGYDLHQNYPNPFNPSTTIEFSLPEAGFATLAVYDILGRQIATLVSGELSAGKHTYHWDSGEWASGVYLYRLSAGNTTLTRKMQIIK